MEMQISDAAQRMIGFILITVPTIQFGGYFLLTQLGRKDSVIRSDLQGSYYRAGHAHAGVLVLLALFAQLAIDASSFEGGVQWAVRIGFALTPILISAGFFGAAPRNGTQPTRLIWLIYSGAVILAVCVLGLGLNLVFA
ncbi:MAG TPA: hypothetical protein VHL11_15900 [Phototrophicaceae bacterium]|jgi:hypothetical protein|nr:hypothetical protein [Phototrophicaceae bacterium]